MKPNFALRLAHDSIELLQRSPDGWLSVGTVDLDDPNLGPAIARLREHAERLAPEGIATKLIIPDTELRYETVLAPGPDDVSRRRQIEAAVDGLTPYALDDLAFDWVVEGDHALVVVAARETLEEAEAFADSHGLNPVSFVGIPARGQFLGEPFFGATRNSATALPTGTRVLADLEPVKVVGRARIPAAQTMPPTSAAKSPPNPAPTAGGAPAPKAPQASREASGTAPKAAATKPPAPTESEPGGAPSPNKTPPKAADPVTHATDPRDRDAAGLAETPPSGAPTAGAKQSALLPSGLRRPATPGLSASAKAGAAQAGGGGFMRRLGKRLRTGQAPLVDPREKMKAREVPPAPKPPTSEGSPAEPSAVAFASRRKPELVAKGPGHASPQSGDRIAVMGDRAVEEIRPSAAERARQAAARMGGAMRKRLRPSGGQGAEAKAVERKSKIAQKSIASSAALTATGKPARASDADKPDAKAPDTPEAATKRSGAASFDRAPAKPPAPTEPIIAKSRPPRSDAEKAKEAEALTIFGARSASTGGGDGPRRGVVAGGLALLIVAFGVWLAYFSFGPGSEVATPVTTEPVTEPAETAAAPTEPVTDEPPLAAADPVETAPPAAEAPAADEVASDEGTALASPDATEPLGSDARLEALVEEALRQAEPTEQFVDPETTALADPGAPADATPGETVSQPTERLALPGPLQRPSVELTTMVSLPPPPPFGTEMELGADGLIVASPEGAMTPEGITVFARPPNEVPPSRPTIVPPEPAVAPDDETPVEDDASAAGAVEPAASEEARLPEFNLDLEPAPGADPALAAFRPLARPGSGDPALPEDELAAVAESAALEPEATPGGVVLAALRPNPRPESVIEQAAATAEPAQEDAPELDLSSATPQAVARSLAPNARPQDFSATVQRALAAAARNNQQAQAQAAPPQAEQPSQAAVPAAPPPQTQTASAQPQIPTSASVAETATERRAINLRRVNLIGVFGAQSNRRALVRMPNGQVVRVQVGDRLDGGQVSAIGDNELRYVRGGRNQVLRIGQSG